MAIVTGIDNTPASRSPPPIGGDARARKVTGAPGITHGIFLVVPIAARRARGSSGTDAIHRFWNQSLAMRSPRIGILPPVGTFPRTGILPPAGTRPPAGILPRTGRPLEPPASGP
jgi:hypothetical protein